MSLYIKSLECAINELKQAHDVITARSVYTKWAVFHNNARFNSVVNSKKEEFDKKDNK